MEDNLISPRDEVKVPLVDNDYSNEIGEERIVLTWNDINVYATKTGLFKKLLGKHGRTEVPIKGKHILKNVSGIAYSGELLAILGSSGTGKTTLLNTLTPRRPSRYVVTGTKCINGRPVCSSCFNDFAYVYQDDLFIGTLTVKEHLIFQALVRMPSYISYKRKLKRVDEVIIELNLRDCENTVIGVKGRVKGISGGEKKRLSLASEIISNPSLLFCDEPTSGLDSFMALNVANILKNLAQKGKTVVCSVHQPSSALYGVFDKVLFMAQGRVAFLGTSAEALEFFDEIGYASPLSYNPADYFIQLLAVQPDKEDSCRNRIHAICDHFEKSALSELQQAAVEHKNNNYENTNRNGNKAFSFFQFRALLWRSWISITKEPMVIRIQFFKAIWLPLLIGAIYYNQELNEQGIMNINGVIYFIIMNNTYQNVAVVINVFCSEMPLFLREHRNGMYGVGAYFISKTLAETPFFLLFPTLYVLLPYFLIGLNPELPRVITAVGVIILVTNVGTSLGYFFSSLTGSVALALSLMTSFVAPFFIIGGYFIRASTVPVYLRWLSYLSWFQYADEALMINQWRGVENITCSTEDSLICQKNGAEVLEAFEYSQDNFCYDICALGVLIVSLRFMAYCALRMKTYTTE